jgi:hypothetical protein
MGKGGERERKINRGREGGLCERERERVVEVGRDERERREREREREKRGI